MEERVNELQMQISVLENEVANLKTEKEDLQYKLQAKTEEADTFYNMYQRTRDEKVRLTSVMTSVRDILTAFQSKE